MVPNPPSHSSLSCEEMDHRVANGRRDGSTVRPQRARCNSALSDGVRTGRSNRTDDRKVLDVTPHWAMALGQDDPTAQTTVRNGILYSFLFECSFPNYGLDKFSLNPSCPLPSCSSYCSLNISKKGGDHCFLRHRSC
ncbi:hypothetical protein OPV22_008502 [Ensete ventricosum]|uniref:Apple domain-containing protein n=1 Tax=Ensete ventricosum TaxID=4639 RepID=A0AAV8PPA4_ENSVE|nr:hypothetical protein OPV22_008502 [Ensete ventricosum]